MGRKENRSAGSMEKPLVALKVFSPIPATIWDVKEAKMDIQSAAQVLTPSPLKATWKSYGVRASPSTFHLVIATFLKPYLNAFPFSIVSSNIPLRVYLN